MPGKGHNRFNMLTLDLATRVGWSSGPLDEQTPEFGHVQLPPVVNGSTQAFQIAFDNWLRLMFSKHYPSVVVFEQPVLPREKVNIITVRKLYWQAGHLEFFCINKAPVREANNKAVKKFWTGNGNASKDDMVSVARGNGFNVQVDDEADALALRFFAIEKMYPQFSGMVVPGMRAD